MADPLTVVLTAAGAPGARALVRALHDNPDGRPVRVVGTDIKDRSIGRAVCDAFHLVPPARDPGFVAALVDVAEREGADLVFPQSSAEIPAIAAARDRFGCPVLCADVDAVLRADDKSAMHDLLAGHPDVAQPAAERVDEASGLAAAAARLGYPDRDLAFKPVTAKGGRGFRRLSERADRVDQLLNGRPGALSMRVADLEELFAGRHDEWVPALVMEWVEGREETVDGIAEDGRVLLAHAKTREDMRASLAMFFETIDAPHLEAATRAVVGALGLSGFFNCQFIGGRLLEINPRISTIVYQPDLDLPWLGVRWALGELGADQLAAYRARVRYGRVALRYYDQLEWDAAP